MKIAYHDLKIKDSILLQWQELKIDILCEV